MKIAIKSTWNRKQGKTILSIYRKLKTGFMEMAPMQIILFILINVRVLIKISKSIEAFKLQIRKDKIRLIKVKKQWLVLRNSLKN